MSTPAYALTIELPVPLPAAIERLRAALASAQMGIVSEVDVQATLKAKFGLNSHPQGLLGLCRPRIAHAMIGAEAALLNALAYIAQLPAAAWYAHWAPQLLGAAQAPAVGART